MVSRWTPRDPQDPQDQVVGERDAGGVPPAADHPAPLPVVSLQLSPDRRAVLLCSIVGVQAVWLGTIMMGGWYTGPDLANLAAATGQPLDWHYLTASMGGHLGIPGRLLFWVLNRTAALSWPLTVALRLVVQAAGTILLWRFLDELVGRKRWTPVVVGLYAFSPLLVPGSTGLSSGVALSVGQLCLLGALIYHVRYARAGQLRDALVAALLVFLMVNVADEALPTLVLLPVLSLGFLHQGSGRERLGAALRRWPEWLAFALGGLVFAALYSQGDYGTQQTDLTASGALRVLGRGWLEVLGPSFVGGPLRFAEFPDLWSSFADPPLAVQVVGQMALVLLVVLAVQTTGRRALLALAVPAVVLLGTLLLTAVVRYGVLRDSLPEELRYSYYLPVVLAVAVTLAFSRTPEEEPGRPAVSRRRRGLRPPRRALQAAVLLVLVASLVSSGEFAHGFWRNPAHDYVDALVSTARAAGPSADVWDSGVPNGVDPYIESAHFVSDLLALSDVSVTFGGSTSDPLLADEHGHLGPSVFVKIADVVGAKVKDCGTFVQGAGTTTLHFGPTLHDKEWYLQLQLYQPHANVVAFEVRDARGRVLAVHSGPASFASASTLVVVNRRLELGTPATLEVHAQDPSTNLCLVHAFIGAPVSK